MDETTCFDVYAPMITFQVAADSPEVAQEVLEGLANNFRNKFNIALTPANSEPRAHGNRRWKRSYLFSIASVEVVEEEGGHSHISWFDAGMWAFRRGENQNPPADAALTAYRQDFRRGWDWARDCQAQRDGN